MSQFSTKVVFLPRGAKSTYVLLHVICIFYSLLTYLYLLCFENIKHTSIWYKYVDYAKTQVYIVSHLEYHSQINLRRATIPTRVQYVQLYQERITGMYRT